MEADRADFRELLRAAMERHDDSAMLDILGIRLDEIPEAIASLTRILQRARDGQPHFMLQLLLSPKLSNQKHASLQKPRRRLVKAHRRSIRIQPPRQPAPT